MGQRLQPLVTGEIYHVYNRGAHKADIFYNDSDRERFLALLLVANCNQPVHLENLLKKYRGSTFIRLFEEEVPKLGERLVDVLAYCLMPNHFHLVVRQLVDGGITSFMRKVATAHVMAHNARHEHSGTLYQGKFKSRHVDSDEYLRWLFSYVHLNPLDLIEPRWKEGGFRATRQARLFLEHYRWSSLPDFQLRKRPERNILSGDIRRAADFTDMLRIVRDDNYKGRTFISRVFV
jgi:putative transposase